MTSPASEPSLCDSEHLRFSLLLALIHFIAAGWHHYFLSCYAIPSDFLNLRSSGTVVIRKMRLLLLPVALISLVVPASAGLISKLAERPELSQFNAYLSQFPRLANTINTVDNITVLAPSDAAITKWLQGIVPRPSPSDIENILNYHILHGTFPVASFSDKPHFVHSFLVNASYSNVTQGLFAGLISINGEPQIRSGLNSNSSIATPVRTIFPHRSMKLKISNSHIGPYCKWRIDPRP